MLGQPVTRPAFTHWLAIASRSAQPGTPTVVPGDPPTFTKCVAQARKIKLLARQPQATLRTDCAQDFRSLMPQVMNFLINAHWYLAYGAANHITVTNAQVQQAFNTEKNTQFPNSNGYRAFLARTGQSQQDLLFRVKVQQTYTQLLAREAGSQTVRTAALNAKVRALYRGRTVCASGFVVADCG